MAVHWRSPKYVKPKAAAQHGYEMASTEKFPAALTPEEVLVERLHLAQDMVFLVLYDGIALPPSMTRTLHGLFEALAVLREEVNALGDHRPRGIGRGMHKG